MSHFAIAVFTNDADPDDTVERALAPFHEFECTGLDDQYVQTIDITEKTRAEYDDPKNTRSMVRLADGTLVSAYEPSLWRKLTDAEHQEWKAQGMWNDRTLPDGRRVAQDRWEGENDTYHPRTPNYPEGSEEVDVPMAEAMTFSEFVQYWHSYEVLGSVPAAETKYGWIELDEQGEVVKIVKRTNPNSKWDWYSIGGRYSERLFVKDGAEGRSGKGERSWGMDGKPFTGGRDSALLADLDLDAMVADKTAERRRYFMENYPDYQAKIIEAGDDEEAIQKINGMADFIWGWNAETMKSMDDYVGQIEPLTAFAALYKGTWNEKGEMGWFGIVTDEKDPDQWKRDFAAILEDAKKVPTMRITIVDCHI